MRPVVAVVGEPEDGEDGARRERRVHHGQLSVDGGQRVGAGRSGRGQRAEVDGRQRAPAQQRGGLRRQPICVGAHVPGPAGDGQRGALSHRDGARQRAAEQAGPGTEAQARVEALDPSPAGNRAGGSVGTVPGHRPREPARAAARCLPTGRVQDGGVVSGAQRQPALGRAGDPRRRRRGAHRQRTDRPATNESRQRGSPVGDVGPAQPGDADHDHALHTRGSGSGGAGRAGRDRAACAACAAGDRSGGQHRGDDCPGPRHAQHATDGRPPVRCVDKMGLTLHRWDAHRHFRVTPP